ncbi:MAG: thioesterase family protein [Thermodesulfobacteriota bacterium]
MGFPKRYFTEEADSPAPLLATTHRRVRFEEVDLIGMAWHGRYVSYFEDGRIAWGDKYGLTYMTFRENEVMAPIVQMHFDFKSPLRFDETMRIDTRLHWCDTLRLNFSYKIYSSEERLAATGYTVQLLCDRDTNIILIPPDWIVEFRRKWQEGTWKTP